MRVGPFGWLSTLAELLRPFHDVAIVVHSSWRLSFSLDELRDMLQSELGERYIDVTPAGDRYASILEWLRDRSPSTYRILDDDVSEFPQPLPAELIVCDPAQGVSGEQVRAAGCAHRSTGESNAFDPGMRIVSWNINSIWRRLPVLLA